MSFVILKSLLKSFIKATYSIKLRTIVDTLKVNNLLFEIKYCNGTVGISVGIKYFAYV